MQNNNLSISQDMNRIFDLKGESTNVIADFIQPTILINRTQDIFRSGNAGSGSSTIYTTPPDKDFYLCSAYLHVITDVVSDNISNNISITSGGIARSIILIGKPSLIASNTVINKDFNPPIKLDRNTNITQSGNSTVGLFQKSYGITGYTVETTK